jgi:hypothetical protein
VLTGVLVGTQRFGRSLGTTLLAGVLLLCCGHSSTRLLAEGTVSVQFDNPDRTCGKPAAFEQPAEGCRVIDDEAVVCEGFGVIDKMLFSGPCEAPARFRVLDKQGGVVLAR